MRRIVRLYADILMALIPLAVILNAYLGGVFLGSWAVWVCLASSALYWGSRGLR